METRQEQLLELIVENYIDTAEPIGSEFLIDVAKLTVSAATVRNEMRDLELAGYLTHPHTSAGRIPTAAGFQYYIDRLMKPTVPKKKIQDEIGIVAAAETDPVKRLKLLGRAVASIVQNAVLIAFDPDTIYYTGLSNVLAQPEFRDSGEQINISALFDTCEERLPDLYAVRGTEPNIILGDANPLGPMCGTIVSPSTSDILFAVIGPVRMNYRQNVGLLQYVHTYIGNF